VSNKYFIPLLLSFLLHLIIATVMLLGDFSIKPKPTPTAKAAVKPIEAVVIDKAKLQNQLDQIRNKKVAQQIAEERRIKALEQRAAQASNARKKEQARIKRLEQERKAKELEKQKAEKAAKRAKAKAQAAEKERQQKETLKRQAEKAAAEAKARRLKAETEARKAEELRKKKLAEEKRKAQEAKERAAQERLLEEQLQQEMAKRQQARHQQMMTEIQRYTALITQTIQRNLITDRSTMAGKSCKLTISLAPSGFVTNVVQGKGDRIVCDAAQKAIYKAGTLPVSKDPEVFKEMRTISLTVVPEFND
jgi:colicin import membrane protein